MIRYFRASATVYKTICQQLDAAYGYPDAETKTDRSLPLAADLSADTLGRVYLALPAEFCGYELPSQILPSLLASGAVEELGEAEYQSVMPPVPPA